jgi:hypothetical protein
MSALEEEASQQAAEKQKIKETQKKCKKAPVSQSPPEVVPSDKAQRNFTDPDSRIMKVSSRHPDEFILMIMDGA